MLFISRTEYSHFRYSYFSYIKVQNRCLLIFDQRHRRLNLLTFKCFSGAPLLFRTLFIKLLLQFASMISQILMFAWILFELKDIALNILKLRYISHNFVAILYFWKLFNVQKQIYNQELFYQNHLPYFQCRKSIPNLLHFIEQELGISTEHDSRETRINPSSYHWN